MIAEFNQITRMPRIRYECRMNGTEVGWAEDVRGDYDTLVIQGRKILMANCSTMETIESWYEPKGKMPELVTQRTPVFRYFDEEMNCIGCFYQDMIIRKKFFGIKIGSGFFSITIDDRKFEVYEVGLGGDRHYFCFIKEGVTYGIIHKPSFVKGYLDRYTLYAKDESMLTVMAAFALMIDSGIYTGATEIDPIHAENSDFVCMDAFLNGKYDPEFIPAVEAMEGLT